MFMLGAEEGNGTCQFLCSWKISLAIPVLPGHTPKLVSDPFSHMPQATFKLLLLCYISMDCFLCCLFKGKHSVSSCPHSSPRVEPMDFLKFQFLSTAGCKNMKFSPSGFQTQMIWDASSPCRLPGVEGFFSPLSMLQHPPFLWTVLGGCIVDLWRNFH